MKRRVIIKQRLIAQRRACASKTVARCDCGTTRDPSFTGDRGRSRVDILIVKGFIENDSMIKYAH
jgi:hypothetical protein